MNMPVQATLRISSAEGLRAVNTDCHSLSLQVPANDKHVLRRPRVIPIMWGHSYATARRTSRQLGGLLRDLATGRFMNGLAQYGVARGSVASPIIVDITGTEPTTLSRDDIQDQLTTWLDDGTVSPKPAVNERNRLYFIFPPTTAALTLPGATGFCGYHWHAKYNKRSRDDDLFFAVVGTNNVSPGPGQSFAQAISYCVSHEFNEACSDRDGKGYTTPTCEIGDICEQFGQNQCCSTFTYGNWQVEYYWSNWDGSCIQGDSPVSVRSFLSALHLNPSAGLRRARLPVVGIDQIAARM
jgi:hypothetical protein